MELIVLRGCLWEWCHREKTTVPSCQGDTTPTINREPNIGQNPKRFRRAQATKPRGDAQRFRGNPVSCSVPQPVLPGQRTALTPYAGRRILLCDSHPATS